MEGWHGAVQTLVLKRKKNSGAFALMRGGRWKGIPFYRSPREGRAPVSWGEKAG